MGDESPLSFMRLFTISDWMERDLCLGLPHRAAPRRSSTKQLIGRFCFGLVRAIRQEGHFVYDCVPLSFRRLVEAGAGAGAGDESD